MSRGKRTFCCVCAGSCHAVHLLVLIWPTLLLDGIDGLRSSTIVFACSVGLAACLESAIVAHAAAPPLLTDVAPTQMLQSCSLGIKRSLETTCTEQVRDPVAMRTSAVVGVLLLLAFWRAQVERPLDGSVSFSTMWIGLPAFLIGMLLRISSIWCLGVRFQSDIYCDSPPVRTGIYQWMRHPSEIGLLLIAISGPLMLDAVYVSIAIGSLLVPISAWRLHREERALGRWCTDVAS